MRRSRGSASPGPTSRGRRRSASRKSALAKYELGDGARTMRTVGFILALLLAPAAFAYLPPKGVEFELVEFPAGGKTLQGGFFSPDSKRFAKPSTGVVLVHSVESYWYQG